jgi:prolyl oligopeptidase
MSRLSLVAVALVVACSATSTSTPQLAGAEASGTDDAPPATRTVDVVETIFGVELRDPYRWMEKHDNADEMLAWYRAQGAYTREWIAKHGDRDALKARLMELGGTRSKVRGLQRRGDRKFFFALPKGGDIWQVHMQDGDAPARLLFDPASVDADGSHASVDQFAPSPDGTKVALNIAVGGSERAQIKVLDVAAGTFLPGAPEDVIGEVPASWLPDGTGFFYTALDPEAVAGPNVDAPMYRALHRLGTDVSKDPIVLSSASTNGMNIGAAEFPFVDGTTGSSWALASAGGARLEARFAVAPMADVLKGTATWVPFAENEDLVYDVTIVGDDAYLLVHKDAPNGKIVRIDLRNPKLDGAEVIVPESDRVIEGLAATKGALVIRDLVDGVHGLRSVPYGGKVQTHEVPAATLSLTDGDTEISDLIVGVEGWNQPLGFSTFDPTSGSLTPTEIIGRSPTDMSVVKVQRVFAPSVEDAEVPMWILTLEGTKTDGERPAFVFGYGGYGTTYMPFYYPELLAWMERGGVVAICNVRGGGAKGPAWHHAGKSENKPKGIRDFVACAKTLGDKDYSKPQYVAGIGGSMGGVLVGRAVTESPEAFGAAIIGAGMLNPLRMLEGPNGENQIIEMVDPRTETGFPAMLAMDAYQNIEVGRQYPAIMTTVGLNDPRVPPWNSAKFTARMQASGSRAPALIRVEEDAGHGVGSTQEQRMSQTADEWAFLLATLGEASE